MYRCQLGDYGSLKYKGRTLEVSSVVGDWKTGFERLEREQTELWQTIKELRRLRFTVRSFEFNAATNSLACTNQKLFLETPGRNWDVDCDQLA
jgi:hypothetical protein